MKVVAVMPAWNEAPRIAEAVRGVGRHVERVIVVDDGSHDETSSHARAAGASVVRHPVNRGQGAALRTGTLAALKIGAEVIVHVDADGQQDPEALPLLLAPLLADEVDVVYGSRFLGVEAEGMPWSRRSVLGAARFFSAYALGIPRTMTDPQSGLRAMRASVAHALPFEQDKMAHCSEILRLVTCSSWRWKEVPVRVRYTEETLEKGNKTSDALTIAWHLLLGTFQR